MPEVPKVKLATIFKPKLLVDEDGSNDDDGDDYKYGDDDKDDGDDYDRFADYDKDDGDDEYDEVHLLQLCARLASFCVRVLVRVDGDHKPSK